MACTHFPKHATFSNQTTLQVLLHLQKGSAEHLLSAYGEWFTEIASSGHISWQDYLLDEVYHSLIIYMLGLFHILRATKVACACSPIDCSLKASGGRFWVAFSVVMLRRLSVGREIRLQRQLLGAWAVERGPCSERQRMIWTSCNGWLSQRRHWQVAMADL